MTDDNGIVISVAGNINLQESMEISCYIDERIGKNAELICNIAEDDNLVEKIRVNMLITGKKTGYNNF